MVDTVRTTKSQRVVQLVQFVKRESASRLDT